MRLEVYRETIQRVYDNALNDPDEHEKEIIRAMTPAEFFAYDAVGRLQATIIGKITENNAVVSDKDETPDTRIRALSEYMVLIELKEQLDDYLSGSDG
jgi:hypothetical protein